MPVNFEVCQRCLSCHRIRVLSQPAHSGLDLFRHGGIIFHIVLNNTRYGRYVCAVGANEKVAVYSAIKIDWVKMTTYALTGLSVAVTSIHALIAAELSQFIQCRCFL